MHVSLCAAYAARGMPLGRGTMEEKAMNHKELLLQIVSLTLVLLVSASCGTAQPAPSPVPQTIAPSPEAIQSPSASATNTQEPTREVWDYVTLGDSFTAYADWPATYASYLEEDFLVEVKLHGYAVGDQTTAAMLDKIRTNEVIRQQIMEAEVITVQWGATSVGVPARLYAIGSCGGADGQDCLREAYSSLEADWVALLDELVALRSPEETHIITFRTGTWLPATLCDWGSECWEVLLTSMVEWGDFVERTAIERGIHVVDVDRVLTGPDYRQPPNEQYLQSDGFHLSQAGSIAAANLLRELELGAETP